MLILFPYNEQGKNMPWVTVIPKRTPTELVGVVEEVNG